VERRDARRSERSFVVEGAKLVGEALRHRAPIESVYLDASGATESDRSLAAACAAAGARILELQPGVLARACDTLSAQPLAAVVAAIDVPMDDLSRSVDLAVICDEVRDPGNVGAIIRTAGAAGAGAVVCSVGSVDVYNPKTVRSSAGALFHLPVVIDVDTEVALDEAARRGLWRWATVARGGTDYAATDLARPTVLVVGNEAHGLRASLAARLDGTLTVPMAGPAESLNVAAAAAVLCFEARRQRRRSARGTDS
jgi:TrmH family RNA methyltransferase